MFDSFSFTAVNDVINNALSGEEGKSEYKLNLCLSVSSVYGEFILEFKTKVLYNTCLKQRKYSYSIIQC